MRAGQFFLVIVLSTVLTVMSLGGAFLLFRPARAAPVVQTQSGEVEYVSVSSMAFVPVQPNSSLDKDVQRQLLRLKNANRTVTAGQNVFVAPLLLPDRNRLMSMVVAGEDYDVQGEVRVRLLRCDHASPACLILAETSSGVGLANGLFETVPVFLQNQLVNNALYSYFLQLELTALMNSGLRSVRVETISSDTGSAPPASNLIRWELSGTFYRYPIPTSGWNTVKICTDDLSYLPNNSHYPYVSVDGTRRSLASNSCLTVQGFEIEIGRDPNTGASRGTYQIIR